MAGEIDGVRGSVTADSRLNIFALVIYIPGSLGRFLDDLRRELTPDCNPRAHISVLPPRPLQVPWQAASDSARATLESSAPFDVHLMDVRVFPGTNVIYLDVNGGAGELIRLHHGIDRGPLSFSEPFSYCPHVTLAQEIPAEDVAELEKTARRRWQEFTGDRKFRAARAVFVQNTVENQWIDLAEYELGALAAKL
jgi:hypothetical protein